MRAEPLLLWSLGLLTACLGPQWTSRLWTERSGPGVGLHWVPSQCPDGATDLTYELAVFRAVQSLPRQRVLSVRGLTAPHYTAEDLPGGDYVFTVRARYRRDGVEWATRWDQQLLSNPGDQGELVPLRGCCPFTVP